MSIYRFPLYFLPQRTSSGLHLCGLDSLPVSICIYDKNTRLVYANADFCDYVQIKDREAVYGMRLDDMLKAMELKFLPSKPHDQLKVKEILKYEKPIVNWEVEVIYTKSQKENILATNDMYPIFDREGKVNGVVEIARLRNKTIREVRSALGLTADYTFDDIIGESRLMAENKAAFVATFAGSAYNILIYGESGVGKELFAQSIHNCSERKNNPFVAINCASIAPELIDSELFGYEGGAFTGASKNGQIGKFELANGGTLFLDEVAELPLHFQTKLLRTLKPIRLPGSAGRRISQLTSGLSLLPTVL